MVRQPNRMENEININAKHNIVIQFLESIKRQKLFKQFPPKVIYVFARNIRCARNGDFKNATGNASTYAWFVWEKGFIGSPIIKWLNGSPTKPTKKQC